MKVAIAYDNPTGYVADSLLEAKHFRVYEIQDNEVYCAETVGAMGLGSGDEKAEMLSFIEADALICGAIDHASRLALFDEGIEFFALCSGNSDDVIDDFLQGRLEYEN